MDRAVARGRVLGPLVTLLLLVEPSQPMRPMSAAPSVTVTTLAPCSYPGRVQAACSSRSRMDSMRAVRSVRSSWAVASILSAPRRMAVA